MKVDIKKLHRVLSGKRLTGAVVERFNCGLFDGACVLLAYALADLLGEDGKVKMVVGYPSYSKCRAAAGHAVVCLRINDTDYYLDGMGFTEAAHYSNNFLALEHYVVTKIREPRPRDLVNAYQLNTFENRFWMTEMIAKYLR